MTNLKTNVVYVSVHWTGDFHYPTEVESRETKVVYEFDHIPFESEIVDRLKNEQSRIIDSSNSDWSNIIIKDYTIFIPNHVNKPIIIK